MPENSSPWADHVSSGGTRWITQVAVVGLLIGLFATKARVLANDGVDPLRLDPRIRPVTQSVHLWLNPASNTYTGVTRVELSFAVPTNRFVFHARSMDLGPTTLNGSPLALTVWTNPVGWVTAVAPAVIPVGVHQFESGFTNNFNRDGAGLYKAVSEGSPYLFTQFEAMDARQAFPCWDEPEFKIPWRITVTAPEGVEVVGNMPVAGAVSGDGTTTLDFGRTPPMPSYLVALAVGRFESLTIPEQSVPGRIVTPEGKIQLARAASRQAAPILSVMERYFGIPYPYPKLDHLAVPAFRAGAMENVGAITYRDHLLLLDDDHAAIEQQRILIEVMAHEVAHQWFGNLVTMRWWDDLWLNEAFATWAGLKVAGELHPELRLDLVEHDFGAAARSADIQPSVKAIRRSLGASGNVSELLDRLTYLKGMAILNMAESWLGKESFRSGLQRYFRRHAWGNARGEDLWQAFTESGEASMSAILRPFIEQPGIPEVALRRLPGNRLEVEQRRYRSLATGPLEETLWQVPLVIRYGVGSESRIERRLLTRKQEIFELPDLDRAQWLYPNAGEKGYYQWSLSPELSAGLRDHGWPHLGVLEQLGMLRSAGFAVDSGALSPVEALRSALAAGTDPRPEIRNAVGQAVVRWRDLLAPAQRAAYAPFLRKVLRPMLDGIGFEPRGQETPAVETLRSDLLERLGVQGEEVDVIAFCRDVSRRALADPQSVPASIAGAALSVATWHGDEAWAQALRQAHKSSTRPDFRMRIETRLAAFRDPALAAAGMDYALTDEVPSTNVRVVLEGRPEMARVRLAWLEKNYAALKAKVAGEELDELPQLMSGADPGVMERARTFFLDPSRRTPLAELRVREVEDEAKLNGVLRERYAAELRAYLEKAAFEVSPP